MLGGEALKAERRALFATAAEWRVWLTEHHETEREIWLQIARSGGATPSVSYDEALDVALTFGWIDGQKAALDDAHWLQRFTPRGPSSRWSMRNRQRAEELIASGRMLPQGQAEVDRAKRDGRWDAAYPGMRSADVPQDFQAALAASPDAEAFFAELDSANRYAILYRLHDAKRPQTRAARIERFVEMLRRRERLHP